MKVTSTLGFYVALQEVKRVHVQYDPTDLRTKAKAELCNAYVWIGDYKAICTRSKGHIEKHATIARGYFNHSRCAAEHENEYGSTDPGILTVNITWGNCVDPEGRW